MKSGKSIRCCLKCLPALLVLGGLLGGCAAQRYNEDGQQQLAEGQIETGLASLRKAILADPGNLRYQRDYANGVNEETRKMIQHGEELRAAGDQNGARDAFFAALKLDNSSERARRGIADVGTDLRHRTSLAAAGKMIAAGNLDSAQERIKAVLLENRANADALELMRKVDFEVDRQRRGKEAVLASQSVLKKPVSLQFRDANLRMVFEALSRTTGLNVIFDREVRTDLKTTIFVRDASVEDTVNLILLQNQMEKKVLNANTMFVYPATAAKQKEYQELKVRIFRISNGDPKYIQTLLKNLLKIKEVLFDERTNSLVLRDTPEALAVAAKIIVAHDQPDAEVMLEVEVLEVSRDRMTHLGIKWPDAVTISTPGGQDGGLTIGALRSLTRDQLLITGLQVGVNLKLLDTDANLLASPRIRVRDREKAKILIGDKVPVITNAITPLQTGAAVITGSIQYIDVGIKLEVEPHIYAEGDVGIKLNIEISNIVKEIVGQGGSLAYQIGTRSAQTVLRLADGETQVMGGLISDSDRKAAAKVPGLGQIPLLGRLFSDNSGNRTKNEIILSITPRIVRSQGVAEESMRESWSGTESVVRESQLRLDPIHTVRSAASESLSTEVKRGNGSAEAAPAQAGSATANAAAVGVTRANRPAAAAGPTEGAADAILVPEPGSNPAFDATGASETPERPGLTPAAPPVKVTAPDNAPPSVTHGTSAVDTPIPVPAALDPSKPPAVEPAVIRVAPPPALKGLP